jgi:hypothetical protein
MCQTSIIIPYDYLIYNLVLPFSIKPIAKIFANMITRCTNYEFCTLFLQHLHSANYSYYRQRLEEKETVFFGRSSLRQRAHHEFNCTRSRCILRAICAADLCTERARVQIPRRARRAFIVIPFSQPGNFHLRVRDPCGGERNAKYAAPRRAANKGRAAGKKQRRRAYMYLQRAVDIARRESFISHSRAMRLMGDGACFSRHAECTRRKKSSMSARS